MRIVNFAIKPTLVHTVWPRMTKFGTVIHTGQGCFNKVMHDPYPKGARPHHSQFWGTSCIRIHSKQILHGAQTRWEENFTESTTPDYIYRVGQKKRGRFVLRLVTLEVTHSACSFNDECLTAVLQLCPLHLILPCCMLRNITLFLIQLCLSQHFKVVCTCIQLKLIVLNRLVKLMLSGKFDRNLWTTSKSKWLFFGSLCRPILLFHIVDIIGPCNSVDLHLTILGVGTTRLGLLVGSVPVRRQCHPYEWSQSFRLASPSGMT